MKSQSKIILVGLLAFFALAYFIWNTFQNSRTAEALQEWVDHSHLVMDKIDQISLSVTQMESNSRGYLVTRDQRFAKAANDNRDIVDRSAKDLDELLADNQNQTKNLQKLKPLLEQKTHHHLSQLKLDSLQGTIMEYSPLRGKALMDSINNILQVMWGRENQLLNERTIRNKDYVQRGFVTTLVGTLTALVFIGIILWQLNTDIQRRKKAEKEVRNTQYLLQSILDNIPLMIQIKDLQGRYLLINKKLKDTFSYTDEMLLGKTDHNVEPSEAEEYERTDNLAIKTKQPVDVNETVMLKNKQYHFHYVKFPLLDPSGEPFAVGGFGFDVTERMEAAHLLQSSEQKMRALLSSTNEGFFMIDRDYQLILINEAGRKIAKFSTGKDAEIGDKLHELVVPERKEGLLQIFARVFEGESIEYEQTYIMDGKKRSFFISVLPVREGDKIIGICVVSRDITDLEKSRQLLIEARKKAESAEKLQEQFLANISHEIRTPLNGIIGMANLIQKTNLSEDQKEFVNIIKFSSDNLLVLINDILDFSKIKAGKLNIEKIEFNIFDIVQKAVSTLQQKAKEKDIGLLIFFHDEVPRLCLGDPYRLNQILSNLLSNAIKFTQAGYIRIEISCRNLSKDHTGMKFRIKDTGIGIAEDKLALIFESFSQGGEDITRKFGGTGLGLTITKQLVELQGGNIGVDSQSGSGTTVTFEIPYEKVDQPARQEIIPAEIETLEELSFPGKTVLVIEDNEVNKKVIGYHLDPIGIITTMVNDGKEAVELLEDGKRFDLIIMDLQMPVMNGFQATAYIRQKLQLDIPIIAMTASALKNEEAKCYELGMNEYLSKPFAPEDLYRVLEMYLNGKVVEKKLFASAKDTPYSLDFISVKKKPEVIAHVLGIILEETPNALLAIREAISNEEWKEAYEKSHKLKSSLGLIQAKELFALMNQIEINSSGETNLEELLNLAETAIEKYNLLKPMLESERLESLKTLGAEKAVS